MVRTFKKAVKHTLLYFDTVFLYFNVYDMYERMLKSFQPDLLHQKKSNKMTKQKFLFKSLLGRQAETFQHTFIRIKNYV